MSRKAPVKLTFTDSFHYLKYDVIVYIYSFTLNL